MSMNNDGNSNRINRNVLKDPWRKFALRAQNLKRSSDSPAIVQMTVIVNSTGNPIFWTEPRVILIEPRVDFDFTSLEKKLSKEEMATLLEILVQVA